MSTPRIFESEYRFCLILWEHEPIKSTELAGLCKEKLDWSKTTTYTVIKRLCDRGVIRSEKAVVTSVVSKEEAQLSELEALMEKVIRGMDRDALRRYSKALLQSGVRRSRVAVCPPAFGEVGLRERIQAVMGYRKPGFLMATVSAGLLWKSTPFGAPVWLHTLRQMGCPLFHFQRSSGEFSLPDTASEWLRFGRGSRFPWEPGWFRSCR